MKPAKVTSKRTRKALPGQLDLFATQNGSADTECSGLQRGKTKRPRKNVVETKARSFAISGLHKGLKSSAPSLGLVDTKAAALKLGLGVSTLEKMRLQRRGPPFIKIARNLVRYRLSDLEDWIASRMRN